VSGSGKSSLVHEVLHDTLARRLHRQKTRGAAHESISGIERIDKIISVDQNPIGNTPMSNPATFTGVFDLIRQLFAQLPESRVRGFQPRRFSFNRPGGRCEACEGNGQKKIEMHFLPDVWVTCDVCDGRRFNPETLAVTYKGKSIADVLNLRVSEAIDVFGNIPKIRRILQTLSDVGLDYLTLGQSAQTLSGGEAQRVKLAAELGRPNTGKTLYVLDEPTTGLHFDDVRKLLDVLHRLVDLGNTVVVVEHNLDVIKNADWVIDLGPEAGDAGGQVVAEGPPEVIAEVKSSHTGRYLADVLAAGPRADRPKYDPESEYLVREGDVDLAEIGSDVQAPWESDGRRWHTRDRLSYQGKPCLWEGAALEFVESEIQKLGGFRPTNWSERSVVEISGPKQADGWFLHAMTGGERLLRLVFRVPKNTFKREALERQLKLKPLNESEGVTAFGDEARVRVVNRRGLQEVTLMINRKEEIDTLEFRAFLSKAAARFHGRVQRATTSPEDVMPWKVNGERWHLGEKGFPAGRKVNWDRRLLPKLIETISSVGQDIEAKWDLRDAVTFRTGQGGQFAKIWTKRDDACDLQFSSPKGLFNLSRLEAAGAAHCEIDQSKDGKDTLLFRFRSVDQVNSRALASIVSEIVSR
jgi:excinuclease ABC subunit A